MTPLLDALSPREEQVLVLIGDGLGLREIADELDISPWTVRSHRDNGRRKLGAVTTAHAAAIVARLRAGVPA